MENSRLIVKNLPKKVTEAQLRQKFSEFGTLTDIKLVNKQNTQRRFCFIGFKSGSEAKSALEYLNNTYFQTCKIQIEYAKTIDQFEDEQKQQ